MGHDQGNPDVQVGERRRHFRYAESTRVAFMELGKPTESHDGRLRDLSEGGVCLMAGREVRVGTRLWLGIFFEHMTGGPLIILADVRRCSPEEGGFALGLEFVRASPAQQRPLWWIQQYLAERDGQPAE